MMKEAGYVGDERRDDGLGLEGGGERGTSFQPRQFYNAKRWSFRQARRRKMAGNFECRARDVRVTSARLDFAFAVLANPAQGAVQVQYSAPGYLQLTFFGPQRTLRHQCGFLARHNPKLIQNLLCMLPN